MFNTRIIASAVQEIFEFMIGLNLSIQDEPVNLPLEHRDSVSGIIGFSGKTRGMVALHCPENVALAITSALLGTEETEVTDDIRDAVGEVSNMIAGGIKAALGSDGEAQIELSIPTTICGERYSVGGFASATRLLSRFTIPAGSFLVEVRFVG